MKKKFKKQLLKIPSLPGVYFFLDKKGRIIYIGKAVNLKSRIYSHFQENSSHPLKSFLLQKIAKIKWKKTDSEIEALILESQLIKKYQPDFNILLKDSSDYFYVAITKELFPKIFITHQKKIKKKFKIENEFIGPFTDGKALKNTLKIIRKIFPFCICRQPHRRYCLNAQMNRCLGVCCLDLKLAKKDLNFKNKLKQYKQNISLIKKIITGQKKKILKDLNQKMKKAAQKKDFEKAALFRDQIKNLEKIFSYKRDLIYPSLDFVWFKLSSMIQKIIPFQNNFQRLEAYDVSHLSAQNAVGAMVVFEKGEIKPDEYRRFKIRKRISKKIRGGNDPAMLAEILSRRLKHREWPLPNLILIDGGQPQLKAVNFILNQNNLKIPVLALAKRKNNLYLVNQKRPISLDSLPRNLKLFFLRIRDQAHKFAIKYHRKIRIKELKFK